ncbi:MAG TPA: aminopeptidase [Candidatus Atribacteria bacterium]|nr:aminopeptidase [Candidatus Atribacteria bacterium]
MLTAKQLNQYANVLIWGIKAARTKKYKKNDIVLIQYDLPAIKLAEVLQEKLLGLGINPVLRLGLTVQMEKIFYKKANQNQLVFQAPGTKELFENLNGAIYLHAPESLTHLKDIDPKRIAKALIARKPFRDILFRREEIGEFGWTLCTLPTHELAKQARLTFEEYTQQIIKACYLDVSRPVEAWNSIYTRAQTIKKWLNSMKVNWYHIESKTIDLRITPGEQRQWIGVSGHNIPSFELFLSPDWRGTEGTYFANQPSFRSGNYVQGVWLKFRKGSVVKIKVEKGEDFTIKQLAMDSGANKVGEFSLTDRRFSKIDKFMANTLYDENFGGKHGNCHIALGSSYSDTYAGNPTELTKEKKEQLGFNDSALHWDLVNTEEKVVTARLYSGKKVVIYEKGEFTS